ncbi:2-oxoacid:acceptor oxidoreductase family protein [Geobacillus sp. 47C-IIb]|uniref:2-oxoacid:acceptor oxidoreductase family protein n=1 Tax=Geobacillus TaxID=129337 RepID=UPI0016802CCF|nr:2-oxoacid:acceptor oxidoreductase family protein [Geobacillus sp. 47C-IIb]QNU31434.1 2-oxoacid:acceptor oxidoreductase family protein [Geobacillus sp. 47C-IIb]
MTMLPKTNEQGFFEIRLESIGGLGANLAGKMFAEAGVLWSGLNGANFSSYGSEKKGTPVKSFIRFCEPHIEIRDHSPIATPHVIGVFHEALAKMVDVTSGLVADGTAVVNSTREFDDIRRDLRLPYGTLVIVDALGIAVEERVKINMPMVGALLRVCSFIQPEAMETVIHRTFATKAPHLVEANIRAFRRGYEEVRIQASPAPAEERTFVRPSPRFGYETQLIGGVIVAGGNSLLKNVSGSRQGFLPRWEADKCIHCVACDNVCPDLCFVWEERVDKKGRKQMFLAGIDYQYCKGCLKCVEACPTAALVAEREVPGFAEAHSLKHSFSFMKGGMEAWQ